MKRFQESVSLTLGWEAQAGRVDVGASISFLSQYPGEAEFLMQPLSCLEEIGGRKRGQRKREAVKEAEKKAGIWRVKSSDSQSLQQPAGHPQARRGR